MAKTKTTYTGQDVIDFVNSYVDTEQKKTDSFQLIELMQEWSESEPKMWGPSIIGFGNYHYKYASGHEGDAPLAAFSPRKDSIVLYLVADLKINDQLLEKFGKFKSGKGCVYIKRLEDIDTRILEELIKTCVEETRKRYPV